MAKTWQEAASKNLRALYDKHVNRRGPQKPKNTQARFGAEHGIGGQTMVWHYLSGHRSLGLNAALKFASAFGCELSDIHPKLEQQHQMVVGGFSGNLLAGLNDDDSRKIVEYIQRLKDTQGGTRKTPRRNLHVSK